jgi:hypothetical protein
MKRCVATAQKAGALGVRVQTSGRLGGSEMSRREWYIEGRMPLHTLRADIDFGQATAATVAGSVGVKVWIYKGDHIGSFGARREQIEREAAMAVGDAMRRAPLRARAQGDGGRRPEPGGKRLIEAGGAKRKEKAVVIEPEVLEEAYGVVDEPLPVPASDTPSDEQEAVGNNGGDAGDGATAQETESRTEDPEPEPAGEPAVEETPLPADDVPPADGESPGGASPAEEDATPADRNTSEDQ